MQDKLIKIGISQHVDLLIKSLDLLKSNRGSIIAIQGEEGFGKTHLCNVFAEKSKQMMSDLNIIIEKLPSPIGDFNISQMQSLKPFSNALEKIITGQSYESETAKSKFYKRVGLTILASVPIIDTFFYAAKELSKDWSEYKKEKASEFRTNTSQQVFAVLYDKLRDLTSNQSLMLIFDDFHFADAQSIELLNYLSKKLETLPIIFVITYKKSILKTIASPLFNFLKSNENNSDVTFIELREFNKDEIKSLIPYFINNYKFSEEFEQWLYENTFGVPGVLSEYLHYFAEHRPFKEDGNLIDNFQSLDFMPSSIHSAFSKTVEKLSDEEKNILSICSAEGREFTVLITSKLLNTDVLTAIKKLKLIQQKFGIVKSLGPQKRYGVKTTIYEFTQAFYKKYFENLLEYEEKVAIHGQISAILKERYEATTNEYEREEIAPYLAAHSLEAGDKETAKSMLLVTARGAQKYGNKEIIKDIYNKFSELGFDANADDPDTIAIKQIFNGYIVGDSENKATDNASGIANLDASNKRLDLQSVRKAMVDYFHQNRFNEVINYANEIFDSNSGSINPIDKAQLLAIVVRSYIELKEFALAEKSLNEALEIIKDYRNPIADCFVYNSAAIYYYNTGYKDRAFSYLTKAAKKTLNLSSELKLLTLANIANFYKEEQPEKAKIYTESARKLAEKLNFKQLADEII